MDRPVATDGVWPEGAIRNGAEKTNRIPLGHSAQSGQLILFDDLPVAIRGDRFIKPGRKSLFWECPLLRREIGCKHDELPADEQFELIESALNGSINFKQVRERAVTITRT